MQVILLPCALFADSAQAVVVGHLTWGVRTLGCLHPLFDLRQCTCSPALSPSALVVPLCHCLGLNTPKTPQMCSWSGCHGFLDQGAL